MPSAYRLIALRAFSSLGSARTRSASRLVSRTIVYWTGFSSTVFSFGRLVAVPMVGSLDALTLGVVLAGGSSNPPARPMATNSKPPPAHPNQSERRRVGQASVRTGNTRGAPFQYNKQ